MGGQNAFQAAWFGGRAQTASLPGGTSAETTADPGFALQAGIPLAAGYAPPAAPDAGAAEDANPCLGGDAGFTTGLAASFFADAYGAGAPAKGSFSLDFIGPATFKRRALRCLMAQGLDTLTFFDAKALQGVMCQASFCTPLWQAPQTKALASLICRSAYPRTAVQTFLGQAPQLAETVVAINDTRAAAKHSTNAVHAVGRRAMHVPCFPSFLPSTGM